MSFQNGFDAVTIVNSGSGIGSALDLRLIKSGQCQLGVVAGFQDTAAALYLKFFDAATPGEIINPVTMTLTSGARWTTGLPGNAAGAGSNQSIGAAIPVPQGINFERGIVVGFATDKSMASVSGPAASAVIAAIAFK